MKFHCLVLLLLISVAYMQVKAEPLINRFVTRENAELRMECDHKLKNIIRTRWKFVSSLNNGVETVYDSQSGMTIKDGFKAHCTPRQTNCSLILLRARKEDSGKYTCWIGDTEESGTSSDSSSMKPFIEIELVIRASPMKKTMIASIGNSVVLPCKHNLKNVTRASWSHTKVQGTEKENVYLYTDDNKQIYSNYEGICGPHRDSCDLKILQVNKECAGKYICMHGDSHGFEEKFGYDPMTDFIEIELIVGDSELKCNEDMEKNRIFLGENDCNGMEPDILHLGCSFSYYGNTDVINLTWIERHNVDSRSKLIPSQISQEFQQDLKVTNVRSSLSVSYEMRDSLFQCILDDSDIKACQLQEFKTQYLKKVEEKLPPMYSDDVHDISCRVNGSWNVQCSYNWIHEVGGTITENHNTMLTAENVNLPGNYSCIATCFLSDHRSCVINAMTIIVQGPRQFSLYYIGIVVGVILLLGLLSLVGLALFWKIRRNQRNPINNNALQNPHEELPRKKENELLLSNENCGNKSKEKCHNFGNKSKEECHNIEFTVPNQKPSPKAEEFSTPMAKQDLTLIKEMTVEGGPLSFAVDQDNICICYRNIARVDSFRHDKGLHLTSTHDFSDILTNVIDLMVTHNNLYVLGRQVDGYNIYIKVIKTNVSLTDEASEVYNCHNHNSNIKLSKLCHGDIILFYFERILVLSENGDVLKEFITTEIYDALELEKGRFAVVTSSDIEIIEDNGNGLLKLLVNRYSPSRESEKIEMPRCIAKDKRVHVFFSDNALKKVFALNHELKFISSLDVRETICKICYEEKNDALLCLTELGKILTIKLTQNRLHEINC